MSVSHSCAAAVWMCSSSKMGARDPPEGRERKAKEEPQARTASSEEEYSEDQDVPEAGKGAGKGLEAPPGAAPKRRPVGSPTAAVSCSSEEDRAPRARRGRSRSRRERRRMDSRSRGERRKREAPRGRTMVVERAPRARADSPPYEGMPVKGGKGTGMPHGRCPICWRTVAKGSGLSQHQWWSVNCNTWRYYMQGLPWSRAGHAALRLKSQRELEEMEGAGATTPAPNLRRRLQMDSAEEVERWWQEVEAGKRKPRGKKKKKPPAPRTPSPEVERPRRPRDPSGSDGEDGPPPCPRIAPGPSRGTWLVSF